LSENLELKAQIEALTKRLDQIQGVQPGSPEDSVMPDYLWDAEKGKMRTFMPEMPTDQGQLHFLCAPGIGDFMWVYAKLWKLCETRDVTFWFQDDQYKRVKQYTDLMGLKTGFCMVDIHEMLSFPGEWTEEELKDGGVFYLHANRHIEAGKRIEDWMPWLPIKNPAPTIHGRWRGETPHDWKIYSDECDYSKMVQHYIVMHMGHYDYAGHNWPPRLWAKAMKTIQEEFGIPVMPIGAWWDEKFCDAACELVTPKKLPCMNMPWEYAINMMVHAKAFIGVDSGSAITAKYLGVPTLQAYPSWLVNPEPTKNNPEGTHMPGSWELDAHPLSSWCLLDEILDKDDPRGYYHWMKRLVSED
jgi:hypothetical protein